jgi:hypothetical protein
MRVHTSGPKVRELGDDDADSQLMRMLLPLPEDERGSNWFAETLGRGETADTVASGGTGVNMRAASVLGSEHSEGGG